MASQFGLSRRAALIGLTASSAGSLLLAPGLLRAAPGACRLTPQSIEGPFYLDPRLVRAGIGEGRAGLPLRLRLQVVEAGACAPVSNARVDVWHADAQGLYSGYDRQGDRGRRSTVGETFLRGTQVSDEGGRVTFETVYPGWYAGRATHVHFKVFVDARTLVTGQMYFPDAVSARVHRGLSAYGGRPTGRAIDNASDWIARGEDPGGIGLCSVAQEGDVTVTSLIVGVDRRGSRRR